ncbi:inovirus Gp2 family protein [Enterobacter kobei]|nr:inovirus Gp2 family protein [Enterobacter kobei]
MYESSNTNEIIHNTENDGVLNAFHMQRIGELLEYAMSEYSRVLAFMVGLNLPACGIHCGDDPEVIARFIRSVNAQFKAYMKRRKKAGKRIYPCKLLYAWVREFGGENGNKHYHVLMLVNREVFRKTMLDFGSDREVKGLLTKIIYRAWLRALRYRGLKRVPVRLPAVAYELNRNSYDQKYYETALGHFSYLAKEYTKLSGDGRRNFGCSQIPRKTDK